MPPAGRLPFPVLRIVSGGQTGVDRAALDEALARGIEAGGWCPKNRRAEDGRIPDRYPLRETPSEAYAERTAWNVRDADGTLVLTRGAPAGGTALTVETAGRLEKPFLLVDLARPVRVEDVQAWLAARNVRVLNVAGPRESEAPGIYREAGRWLAALFDRLAPRPPD